MKTSIYVLADKYYNYIQQQFALMRNSELDYKRIFQLCTILIFSLSGLSIIAPILPLIQAWGDVSAIQIGVYVSSFALARLFANIPAGIFTDRYGGRFLMIISLAVIMTGMLMSALAPTYIFLIISRIITGVGSAFTAIAIQTEFLLLAKSFQRATVMSFFMIARRVGVSIFPFIGGALAVFFDWRAVFYFCAILNFIALIIAVTVFCQKQRKPISSKVNKEANISEEPPLQKRVISPLILMVLYILTFTIFINRNGLERTLIPLFGDSIGLDSLKIGFTLTLSSIVSILAIFLGGRAADRYGRKVVLQVGLILLLLASGLFLLVNSFAFYIIANIIFGLAAFTLVLPMIIAADLSFSSHVGRTVSRIRLFQDAGMLVGPVFLGWAMDLYSFPVSIVISIILVMLSLILTTFGFKS